MVQLRRNDIPGAYQGTSNGVSITLRIDAGADDSLDVISGDLAFEASAGALEPHHSFQSSALIVEDEADHQMIRCPVKVHRGDILDIARIDVKIPDQGSLQVTYTFYQLTQFGRQQAAEFIVTLQKTGTHFRRVELEADRVAGVDLPFQFNPCDSSDTPSDVPCRNIGVLSSYRDAGIDLFLGGGVGTVPGTLSGLDQLWSSEELHAAMVDRADIHADVEQWKLYLLLATRYSKPSVLGIMFDSGDDFPRQGAAVFAHHPDIASLGTKVERDREYLYTIIHELGHAFNLLHAFDKGTFETHGLLPRPASPSWMNYPQLYPFGYAGPTGWDGSSAFWSEFRFRFDEEELRHLRHDDRSEVIMGGSSFGSAGHLTERPFHAPRASDELELSLWLPRCVDFLEQVEGDLRLKNLGQGPVGLETTLDPSAGEVTLLIQRSNARYPVVYQPHANACTRTVERPIASGESIYAEVNPSYGRRFWYIDEPGNYHIQAVLRLPDGRSLASNVCRLRVLQPSDKGLDRAAGDFFDGRVGTFLAVEGSRADFLGVTNDRVQNLAEEYADAAVSEQIRLITALREARPFKSVAKQAIEGGGVASAQSIASALGYDKQSGALPQRETRSNLRINRVLRGAVLACLREENQEKANQYIVLLNKFLGNINAPQSASSGLQELKSPSK